MCHREITEYLRETINLHEIHANTYLDVVSRTLLYFLKLDATQENRFLQTSICEFLFEFVKGIPNELAFATFEVCSKSLNNSFLLNDAVMQTLFMRVLSNILLYCDIETDVQACEILFIDEEFSHSLRGGLHVEDNSLRLTWMNFITDILPFLSNFLEESALSKIIKSLFDSYDSVILATKDFRLLQGLTKLLHISLGIEINLKKESLHYQSHPNVKAMITNNLDTLFRLGSRLYKAYKSDDKLEYPDIDLLDEIHLLFTPITNNFTQLCIGTLLDLWVLYPFQDSHCKKRADIFSTIIPCFNIQPLLLIHGTTDFLVSIMNNRLDAIDGLELCVGNFLYTLLQMHIKKAPKTQFTELWVQITKFLRILLESYWVESGSLCLSILGLLAKSTFLPHLNTNKKQQKEIQEIVDLSIEKCYLYALKSDRLSFQIPFPGILAIDLTVYEISITTLKHRVLNVLRSYYPGTEKLFSVVSLIIELFLAEIPKSLFGVKIASEFILEMLEQLDLGFVISFKRRITDFICTNEFFNMCDRCPGTLSIWLGIISKVTQCYAPNHSLVTEILSRYEIGFLTFASTNKISHNTKSSLLALGLLLLSGTQDDYIKSLDTFINKIQLALKKPENFPFICVLLESLLYKINQSSFLKIWTIVWPDIHVMLLTNLKLTEDIELSLAGLKLLDLLVCMGFEEIYSVLCLYVFDVSEIELTIDNTGCDLPVVAEGFLKGFFAKPARVNRRKTGMTDVVIKKPLCVGADIQTLDELDQFANKLIQFCMYYSSAICKTDYQAVEQAIGFDLLRLNRMLTSDFE